MMNIGTSLVCIAVFWAIYFYICITNSSAIQRYHDLHEFREKRPDEIPRAYIIQKRIVNDTGAIATEKGSNINVNHSTKSDFSIYNIKKSSAIQRYRNLHEFRKTKLVNDTIPRANKNNNIEGTDYPKKTPTTTKTTTPYLFGSFVSFSSDTELSTTTSTSTAVSSPPIITPSWIYESSSDASMAIGTTTSITSSISTEKISAVPILGCKATCGSCTEITPVSGDITSPNYPEHYYSATDIGYIYCQFAINAPAGKRIHLVFRELNLAFTDWGDFLEVVDKSHDNYGKVLATFNAGDEAVSTTTTGESMFVFFEGNQGGYTKSGKAPSWKATYRVVEK